VTADDNNIDAPLSFPQYQGIPIADHKTQKPLMKLMKQMMKPRKLQRRVMQKVVKKKKPMFY
jgi:hypothetical protein